MAFLYFGTPTRSVNERRVALAVLAIVLAASLVPPGSLPSELTGKSGNTAGLGGADKLTHALGYTVLTHAVLRLIGAQTSGRRLGVRQVAVVVLAVAALGASVELLQSFVGRTTSPLDALANLVGSVAGATVHLFNRSR